MRIHGRLMVSVVLLTPPLLAIAGWDVPSQSAAPATAAQEIRATAVDPVGDTFNPGPDITSFSAETDGTDLILTLTFDGAIEPPPGSGGGNEVIGFIDIDADQDALTGIAGGNVGIFCPSPPAIGMDFFIDLGSYDAMTGTADVVDASPAIVGTAQVTYGANTVTAVVANALLSDDGIADLNTVIGNSANPTDCAPDGALLTSTVAGAGTPTAVPMLNTWGLVFLTLLAGVTGLVAYRRFSA